MALLFMDSFDHYAHADLTEKWTSRYTAGGSAATTQIGAFGRRSSSGFRALSTGFTVGSHTPALSLNLTPSGTTCIVGCAFMSSTFSGLDNNAAYNPEGVAGSNEANGILAVRNLGVTQVWFHLNNTGTITAYRGTTALGTSSALSVATFNYLEVSVTIHDTTGAITIRNNGTPILTLINIDTNNGTVGWNEIIIGRVTAAVTWDYDDLYVLDGSGAAPLNGFLNDCRVDARFPTAAGATTGWTPSAGSNYQNVDDAAPDDDTTYNSSSTTGATDTFVTQDAAVAGATLFGVQHCLNAKKMDAGSCSLASVVRHSSTDYPGSDLSPSINYAFLRQVYPTNPGTGAAWAEADFNAMEFGYRKTA